jgi:hypothetical protein
MFLTGKERPGYPAVSACVECLNREKTTSKEHCGSSLTIAPYIELAENI